jgi:hypothetical protein
MIKNQWDKATRNKNKGVTFYRSYFLGGDLIIFYRIMQIKD